mmetsp:Transcript_30225/g.50878  ORF Transcript_30225/g.50878 Transcript_30225/m.50878 type:complete len:459 (-) Transcript_30225:267-1643(-)
MELEVSYDLLGVEPTVSDRFLRDTFRDLALALHPAANEGAERRKALRKFQEIQTAYMIILNHRKGDDNDEEEGEQMVEEDSFVNEMIYELLLAGVISQARLPFGCPSTTKRIGDKVMFEVDYSVLKSFPEGAIPHQIPPQKIFEQCKDAKVFSLIWLDSHELFWPVPTPKDAKAQTAFFTPTFLHFEWNMVCKMLPNADSIMQRRVETALGRLNGECCLAVLDKIVVFSTDGGKHMHDVERATKKLKKAEMTVDLHRSGFGFGWEGLVKLLREESAHAKLIKLADDPNAQTEAADAGPSTKGNENEGPRVEPSTVPSTSGHKTPSKAPKSSPQETPSPQQASNEKKAVSFDLRKRQSGAVKPAAPSEPSLDDVRQAGAQEELRLEYELFEQERKRVAAEEREKRKSQGKRDMWDTLESPLFAVFMVQLAMGIAYWYFTEYVSEKEAEFDPVEPLKWIR